MNQPEMKSRIYSIDVLRGVIMIIMALDHVRDFFHVTASIDSPTNLETTTPQLFFTRWITHFCAPIFVFLAGVSAYLMGRKKTKSALSGFLIKRGCWLVVVEIIVVSLAWTFNPAYNILIIQVIWAIGLSMILLGLFVWLPPGMILISGLLIICFHNLLDYAELDPKAHFGLLWEFAHHGKFTAIQYAPHHIALIVYAFLPWTGIMFLGYGLGYLFTGQTTPDRRRIILFRLGIFSLILFTVLRMLNIYGDPAPWHAQRNTVYTFFSFINVTKYPPSLDYISLTLGVALIVLGLLDRITKEKFTVAGIFGRVPFFYYVLHLYLIHAIGVLFFFLEKYPARDIPPQSSPFYFRPDHFGFGLAGVYGIWIAVIAILYPLCRGYDRYKRTHRQWWLSYL